jgi:RNA polymerase sigma factor (sigma-70 family)
VTGIKGKPAKFVTFAAFVIHRFIFDWFKRKRHMLAHGSRFTKRVYPFVDLLDELDESYWNCLEDENQEEPSGDDFDDLLVLLPESQKSLIRLRFKYGVDLQQIADTMNDGVQRRAIFERLKVILECMRHTRPVREYQQACLKG